MADQLKQSAKAPQIDSRRLREVRGMVSTLSSMVAPSVRGERLATLWAFDQINHVIEWTPFYPIEPYDELPDDEVKFNVIHECQHALMTQIISTRGSRLASALSRRGLRRWWNWLEDVRIERDLLGSIWEDDMRRSNARMSEISMDISNGRLSDQVGMLLLCENSMCLTPRLSIEAYRYVESRDVASASYSKDAQGVLDQGVPYYAELYRRQQAIDFFGQECVAPLPAKLPTIKINEPRSLGSDNFIYLIPGIMMLLDVMHDAGVDVRVLHSEFPAMPGGLDDKIEEAPPGAWDLWEARNVERIADCSFIMRRELNRNKQTEFIRRQRRGQFDSSRAWRASRGDTRIMRRRRMVGDIDYRFALLVDVSASIRYANAASIVQDSVVTVSSSLEKLRIPTMIITWARDVSYHKPLGARLDQHKQGLAATLNCSGGDTREHVALLLAEKDLPKVSDGSRRVVICITDGKTNDVVTSSQVIERMTHDGVQMTCIEVGNNADAMHWPNRVRVENARDLPTALSTLLREYIASGR